MQCWSHLGFLPRSVSYWESGSLHSSGAPGKLEVGSSVGTFRTPPTHCHVSTRGLTPPHWDGLLLSLVGTWGQQEDSGSCKALGVSFAGKWTGCLVMVAPGPLPVGLAERGSVVRLAIASLRWVEGLWARTASHQLCLSHSTQDTAVPSAGRI